MRSSALFEVDGRTFLVDTPPELRLQALAHGLRSIDAVFYTHYHADHTHGIDDLKAFNYARGGVVECHGNEDTGDVLRANYAWAFAGTPFIGAIPHLTFTNVRQPFDLQGVRVTPIELEHGRIISTGWRIGDVAYLTDCSAISGASMDLLRGVDTVVVDGVRLKPHPTHFSVQQAIEATRPLGARRTVITHMNHDIEFNAVTATLPPGVELGYDGLTISL
ncbi:MAG: MBL fold metallo-hydrolase [Chloroflexota bacterium]